jgi:Effector Associated Constant Component 1
MELELEASSERFDPLDDRWLDQVAQLVTDLRREVGQTERRSQPKAGVKGIDLGTIFVSLGPASAFTAVAGVIKEFIHRDRGRSVRATWHENGKCQQIEIRGYNIDDVDRLVVALRQAASSSE